MSVRVLGARSVITVSGTREQRVAGIAAAQCGIVSRRQLRAAGIGSGVIDRLVRKGRLLRVHRGVFAVAGLPSVPLAAETAALLSIRDGALLSHHSAAALWGMTSTAGGLVHVLVRGNSAGHRRGVRIHRTELLDASDARVRNGLPVTSPIRTLLDDAPSLEARELERAFDQAQVGGLFRLRELATRLQLGGDRRGLRLLRALAERETGTTVTRSQAEERFLELVRQAGLPAPHVNAHRYGYELDFFWEQQRFVVEIDGYAFHRSHGSFERDRRRDAKLRAVGVSATRVTWLQLVDEPLAVIARLAAGLATA